MAPHTYRKNKRTQLSLVVARGHRMLFFFLVSMCVIIGAGYLFWVNHMGIQGIVLSELSQEKIKLNNEVAQLDARIASYSASKFLADTPNAEKMILRDENRFLVLKNVITAQVEAPLVQNIQ